MKNKYFPDEEITADDLFFICYMIERVARKLQQHNCYVVNKIGRDELYSLLSNAQVLHSLNPLQVEKDWITDYDLKPGIFDITDVDKELCSTIPAALDMGRVYARLVASLSKNYVEDIFNVYNSDICTIIDNYNSSAYYEPSYVLARAYLNDGF